jgi:ABC-type nitrate/sulfonate/bicarbonate transport system ATPase subunit
MGNRVVVMSARPGRIKCDLPVPLPHPRHYAMKTTPAVRRAEGALTEEIRIEVRKAAGLEPALS